MIEKAIEELEYLSQDDKTRQLYEEQLKAELDYNSGIYVAFRDLYRLPQPMDFFLNSGDSLHYLKLVFSE
jgi:hypothetical protein